MATLSITVPDAQVPRLVADIAAYRGVDISSMNLAQKAAFMKQDIASYWLDIMNQQEVAAAGNAAALAAIATRKADIIANLTVT